MPDHPRTFIKMIKGRANAISVSNGERRQFLNPHVIWGGCIDRFKVFRSNVEGHYEQIGSGYLFDTEFQTTYFERFTGCYADFLDEVPSASQIKEDGRTQNCALLSAFQAVLGRCILMEKINKQDGIWACYQYVSLYETAGNVNVRIKKLENVITRVFNKKLQGGLIKHISTNQIFLRFAQICSQNKASSVKTSS
jgi:hypothetical protein